MNADNDPRRRAPATERNRDPILAVLRSVLPARGVVLEIASGTGEHAAYFATGLPAIEWQPSDLEFAAVPGIDAWNDALPNVRPAVALDVERAPWPLDEADALFCANMIHIAPWSAALGLLRGAGRILPPGGPLILYGPFKRGGRHTAPSNEAFDSSLRARDPAWGIRDLADVAAAAGIVGLTLDTVVEMPANNLTVVLRRVAS
ncbi:MAG: DUF938 domain-containing protein [Rhodospirillales bacterium]|nr:MAG: DUF938 domain-containing protein [Rhodospirillales bacterium]